MTDKQIAELLKLLSKHFIISICSTYDHYIITTRLLPTDRFINVHNATFEGAVEDFCKEVLEHVGGKLKRKMEGMLG